MKMNDEIFVLCWLITEDHWCPKSNLFRKRWIEDDSFVLLLCHMRKNVNGVMKVFKAEKDRILGLPRERCSIGRSRVKDIKK